jgi:hypothetical protein
MRWLRVDERDVSNIIGANPDVIKRIPVVKYRKKGSSIPSSSPLHQQQPQEIAQPSLAGPHSSSPIPPPKPARLASPLTTSPGPNKPTRTGSSPGPNKPSRTGSSPGPSKPPRSLSISSTSSVHIPSFSPENEIELDEDDAICVICLNRYIDGENLRRLHCLHHFHKKVFGLGLICSALMSG